MVNEKKLGLYVHVPFCLNKCLYCDFYSETDLDLFDDYISALEIEISMHSDTYSINDICVDSIYFGGGTPSLLGGSRISSVMETIQRYFRVSPESEITIEANPGALKKADLKTFLDSGINRINFGVQSFNDSNLRILGRIHSAKQAKEALEISRIAGFGNIGLDIIFGIPGQTSNDLKNDLYQASEFRPEHISCYSLTYEEGTPFFASMSKGIISPLSDDDVAQMFVDAGETLAQIGYKRYEISNFGRLKEKNDHYYSRHNMKYWSHDPYLGFGPAAHSFDGKKRWWNQRGLKTWISELASGRLAVSGEEVLSKEELMTETIFLTLRTISGLDLKLFKGKFDYDIEKKIRPLIDFYESDGFAFIDSGRLILTEKGMLAADAITKEILNALDPN